MAIPNVESQSIPVEVRLSLLSGVPAQASRSGKPPMLTSMRSDGAKKNSLSLQIIALEPGFWFSVRGVRVWRGEL
jgi:hypothetical protein